MGCEEKRASLCSHVSSTWYCVCNGCQLIHGWNYTSWKVNHTWSFFIDLQFIYLLNESLTITHKVDCHVTMLYVNCSLVGSIIIVVGFYSVIWGKAKEWEKEKMSLGSNNNNKKMPLLQDKVVDDPEVNLWDKFFEGLTLC